MDRIGGWEEGNELGNWVGAGFAARMWVYTTAVVCNGQRNMQSFRVKKMNSIMEAFNWVGDDILDDHEWVSEFFFSVARN